MMIPLIVCDYEDQGSAEVLLDTPENRNDLHSPEAAAEIKAALDADGSWSGEESKAPGATEYDRVWLDSVELPEGAIYLPADSATARTIRAIFWQWRDREDENDEAEADDRIHELLAALETDGLHFGDDYMGSDGDPRPIAPYSRPEEQQDQEQTPQARLEYLRGELRAERISYLELAELTALAVEGHIPEDDVEMLEAAGVPEHEEERAAWFAERREGAVFTCSNCGTCTVPEDQDADGRCSLCRVKPEEAELKHTPEPWGWDGPFVTRHADDATLGFFGEEEPLPYPRMFDLASGVLEDFTPEKARAALLEIQEMGRPYEGASGHLIARDLIPFAEANARRVAICVNICAGMEAETLDALEFDILTYVQGAIRNLRAIADRWSSGDLARAVREGAEFADEMAHAFALESPVDPDEGEGVDVTEADGLRVGMGVTFDDGQGKGQNSLHAGQVYRLIQYPGGSLGVRVKASGQDWSLPSFRVTPMAEETADDSPS